MLLKKEAQPMIFRLGDDGTFDNLGEINQFSSLMWSDSYDEYSNFELWAPMTDENIELIKIGNIIWLGGENAAMIEIIKPQTDENGQSKLNAKGRTLEMLLTTRVLWGDSYTKSGYASNVIYDIVNKNCINTTDANRKIPFLEMSPDTSLGEQITFQKTGGSVYDSVYNIASSNGLGFKVVFKPYDKKLLFVVYKGVDRTDSQSIVDPVILSTELEDILESTYYSNSQDYKSVALVAGEGEDTARKKVVAGLVTSSGFGRRELYVDARDLQSTYLDGSGTQQQMSTEDYEKVLLQRGSEKLSENKVVESFEAKVRVIGDTQYKYEVDYEEGDKVTIIDEVLGVKVSAEITYVEEVFNGDYSIELTFGYSYPTILKKIKQKIG